jgi:hypothetical protein
MPNKSWTVEVEQAPDGEYFIQLTDEMLEHTDFKIGDEVEWIDRKDGSWELRKKQPEMAWVLVEAVQQFRMRYMVQVPASNPEWAMDTVVMKEAKEFSQYDMGETIVSHRVVSEEEAFEICDKDNDYTKSWNDEQKMRAFFTKDGEKVEL